MEPPRHPNLFLIFIPNHFLSNSVPSTSTSCRLPEVEGFFTWGVPKVLSTTAVSSWMNEGMSKWMNEWICWVSYCGVLNLWGIEQDRIDLEGGWFSPQFCTPLPGHGPLSLGLPVSLGCALIPKQRPSLNKAQETFSTKELQSLSPF